jgi:hypothetical protein
MLLCRFIQSDNEDAVCTVVVPFQLPGQR